MVVKGSLVVAASTAPPHSRAEVLAGFFLGAYIGLSLPVVGLGIATTYSPPRDVMLVFAALAALAIAASVRAVTQRSAASTPGPRHQTHDPTSIGAPTPAHISR
jgi:hypothetical protein